jgi:hypothetical protein
MRWGKTGRGEGVQSGYFHLGTTRFGNSVRLKVEMSLSDVVSSGQRRGATKQEIKIQVPSA